MSNCNNIVSVLTKNGSDQNQRYIDALQPQNINLYDFEIADWILFAYNFAEYVNYFDTSSNTPSGNWQSFFDNFKLNGENPTFKERFEFARLKKDITTLIEDYKTEANLTPHLTLFISFLLLLEKSKERYNNLTKKHLDFYFNEILKLNKQDATPDKVYMIFELAKNATQQNIEAKTAFDGGKDASGKSRTYYSNDELIANKAKVGLLKNVYHDAETKRIFASPIPNSYDGLGKAFPDENTQWWPFGYTKDINYPNELPDATLGFAIASPILSLKEGIRNIEFTITFEDSIESLDTNHIINNTSIYITTEKKWFEIPEISETIIVKSGSHFVTDISDKIIKITFQLDENVEAIVNYNSKNYGDEFNSELPIAKFLINTTTSDGYELYKSIAQNKLESICINVDVKNIKSVVLENDNSIINATKPFYPFTTIPVIGSNFYIKYEEAFSKKWVNIDIDIAWKNTPDNFAKYYKAYKNTSINPIDLSTFITKQKDINEKEIVTNNEYFKFDLNILTNNTWSEVPLENHSIFSLGNTKSSSFKISKTNYNTENNGTLKMILNTSFLHSLYPKIYAMAFASKDNAMVLPNEPYTPFIESLTLNYSASETINFISDGIFTLEEVYHENKGNLFHIHPFGYAEEHSYLKSTLDYVEDTNSYLAPTYCQGGELYIGLENTAELEQITLLFQVLEGSENPLTPSFSGKQKIEWSVLGNNQWKTLEYADILLNDTDNLLQSGIFKFNLPRETTQNNTTLPKDYVWLKAKMHKKFDVVCKIIGIHAQAVVATFEDNSNDLSHLETGLEAKTISKLNQRLSSVKSVTQPYNSFDYKPQESDSNFYQRVSERLRHKNRAITMWDYEHIILQEFPELYKVKCLNHTSETSYQAPGNVTLVVIPDTVKKNVFDIYQPRVSTATLNKVNNHITKLNSKLINTFVINPNYEEVTVDLKVKFKSGYDENYYAQELNTDITKFLSPWAYDKNIQIIFGVNVHISSLITYIEKLDYVDYLQDVKLLKKGALSQKTVSPSNPKSILVSAKSHFISTDVKGCKTTLIEPKETCQL